MKQLKTIITIIICFLALSCYEYGFYVFNQGCKIFPNQCDDGSLKTSAPTLESSIIQAAGYFLQAQGDFKLFQAKLELSSINGIDFAELQTLLDDAILNLELANSLYFEIWERSLTLKYDPAVIEKLKTFEYSTYRVDNRLIPEAFNQVECLLKVGDVRGIFKKAYLDTGDILEKLQIIKKSVDAGTMPEVSKVWRLNQSYSNFDLFGQYSSEVFMQL